MPVKRSAGARQSADLDVLGAARLSGWLQGYKPLPGVPDELIDATRRPRPDWLHLLADFAEYPEEEARSRFNLATRHMRDTGVSYRVYGEETERSWPLNPLPLLLGRQDWATIVRGVEQRANLMEAVLRDIYGEASLVARGDLPAAVLTGGSDYIRAMRGAAPAGGSFLQLYAVDLGRGPDGRWWVLDDRAQAPSGAGYALENRLVLSRAFPNLYNAMNVQRLAPFFDELRKSLTASAGRQDPRICLLTPGPFSETYFEQAHLARYLGFLLVEGDDLTVRDGKVYVRTVAGLKRADAILRRVDSDFLDPLELNSASRLGTPGLLEAIRTGGVSVLNMPGSGVLESKALLGFLPRLCRRLLGEELKLPNVATWWCGQPRERGIVEGAFDRMAVGAAFNTLHDQAFAQPRLLSDMSEAQRRTFLQRFADRPGDFVGQEVVRLSTTPTLRSGRLEPAPFVLRVYATATPDGFKVMPGGFCRTSDLPDARAISMGQDVRTADVWVLADGPVERISLLASKEDVGIRRMAGRLPSRAADNLYWLGRYLERAEATLRLVRALCTSLMDSESAVHSTGETLNGLERLLVDWGALDEAAMGENALDAARDALHDQTAYGSVIYLVRAARRAASSLRERLSGDFWTLLTKLETRMLEGAGRASSEAAALEEVESALQTLAALAGLAQENMNRGVSWRFLDMGRRVERGVNICRFARMFADSDAATIDDLDLLLDLADSQITYRARYLVGLALSPVLDMVLLDPFNTRSLAFQVEALKDHVAALPRLVEDGMPETPERTLLGLSAQLQTIAATDLEAAMIRSFEEVMLRFSGEVGDRYFLQAAGAPATKLVNLA